MIAMVQEYTNGYIRSKYKGSEKGAVVQESLSVTLQPVLRRIGHKVSRENFKAQVEVIITSLSDNDFYIRFYINAGELSHLMENYYSLAFANCPVERKMIDELAANSSS